ncbi:hypothetical protein LTR56_003062 [Elasticomyces elasticus]|nr:hypothetical protein LTR56_003062 [Elasticomyces elasticus]KAK3662124.1 hypothetical protein LTR22_007097 [Elasticomyces elasticus]KAK4927513.1 hypothetical protein LTR49_005653 [Elasticomyces elasticus]KAK5749767.1 hypothetical protein LTS12_020195 [Elasticomyces elasticus]
MANRPKTIAEFRKFVEDIRQRSKADRTRNPPDPANERERLDEYVVNVLPCDTLDHTREILEIAVNKIQAIPEATNFFRYKEPDAKITYCLPKGTNNPISGEDAEFEGKVTIKLLKEATVVGATNSVGARTSGHIPGVDVAEINRFLYQGKLTDEEKQEQ